MKKVSLWRFFILDAFCSCMMGMVHPITPTIFKSLNFPDYVFGIVSAVMALGMLIFSPIWGKLGDKIGYSKVFIINLPIYAISQLAFGLSTTVSMTIIARFFGGISGGGARVSALAYIVNAADTENRGRIMSYYAAINAVSGSIGYFIGGVLGNISVSAVFFLQISVILLIALFTFILIEDAKGSRKIEDFDDSICLSKKSIGIRDIMSKPLALVLIIVFISTMASFSYDNALNYYLKADLNLPSTYNGVIKAITGIIGLVVNFTITTYIIRKTNIRKSFLIILLLCSMFTMMAPFILNLNMFFMCNIIYFMFYSMYIPIQQVIIMEYAEDKTCGIVAGLFNSVKSIAMIIGALGVGFLYSLQSKLPFVVSSLMFFIAFVVSFISYISLRRIKQN